MPIEIWEKDNEVARTNPVNLRLVKYLGGISLSLVDGDGEHLSGGWVLTFIETSRGLAVRRVSSTSNSDGIDNSGPKGCIRLIE